MGMNTHGSFVWYDLMTDDVDGAKAFYAKVAGLGTESWEHAPPDRPYSTWTTPVGGMMGGVMKLPAEAVAGGARPHWMGYVQADDVDATTRRAKELGASVFVEPTDIPMVGRFSVLADPQGALVAFFTPGAPMEGPDDNAFGHVCWNELATTDMDAAFDFYSELFGWKISNDMDMGEMGIYRIYSHGGRDVGAMYDKPAEMPGPPGWTFYVHVPDLDASTAATTESGGQVLMGPHEVPGGDRIIMAMDPQGAGFALHAKGAS